MYREEEGQTCVCVCDCVQICRWPPWEVRRYPLSSGEFFLLLTEREELFSAWTFMPVLTFVRVYFVRSSKRILFTLYRKWPQFLDAHYSWQRWSYEWKVRLVQVEWRVNTKNASNCLLWTFFSPTSHWLIGGCAESLSLPVMACVMGGYVTPNAKWEMKKTRGRVDMEGARVTSWGQEEERRFPPHRLKVLFAS